MTRRRTAKDKCLVCGKPEVTRGLCGGCHRTTRRKINAGEVTEDQLLKAGLIAPRKIAEVSRRIAELNQGAKKSVRKKQTA